MYQKIHPYRAISIDTDKLNTFLQTMRECGTRTHALIDCNELKWLVELLRCFNPSNNVHNYMDEFCFGVSGAHFPPLLIPEDERFTFAVLKMQNAPQQNIGE